MSKTHWREIIESRYLAGSDLDDGNGNFKSVTLTIKRAGNESILDTRTGQNESALLVYFEEHKKPMVLNVVNSKMIAKLAGSEYIEDWRGVQIEIGTQKVKAFGELHNALRVKPTKVTKVKPKGDMTGEVLTGIKDYAVEKHGDKPGGQALLDLIAAFAGGKWQDLDQAKLAEYTKFIDEWTAKEVATE